ncbi:MAG: polysaccharide deacetylase family protein [Clostridia bacterium]|nr:polysaccharide deacetylase family protein [Clostridia bacterium]
MGITNIIYLTELTLLILSLVVLIIVLKVKKKKITIKKLGIILGIFATIFLVTFLFEKPDIDIQSIKNIEVKTGEKINISASYHFQDVSKNVRIIGNIDYNKIGEYEVVLEVDTLFGKYNKNAIIKVVDTTKPELVLEGGAEFNQSYAKDFEEPGIKAIDNYDGDISDKIKTTKEDIDETHFNIKYEIEDSSKNKAEATRKVTIVDDVPPVIDIKGFNNMNIVLGSNYEEPGATAIDEKDGDLSEKIVIEGQVDTSKEGTYTITYKVSDSKGNEAVKERIVNVKKQLVYSEVEAQSGSSGQAGIIYLTFDDGPSSNITPKVLDILKEKNVKATFFILNYGEVGEGLVKREFNEGHTVAIHGYSHDYNTIYKSEEAYMSNITKLQEKIRATTGYNATITRFPGGSSNTVSKYNPGIMTRLCNLLISRGYKYFDWNVSSGDAGGAQDSDDIYNNVTMNLSKSRANVVLMHDFSSNSKLLDALSRIIDFGIENGYRFSNITENTPMVTHKPNN